MVNQELLNYVNQQLVYGTSPSEIKRILLDTGWQENDIDEAINKATILFPEIIQGVKAGSIFTKNFLGVIVIGILIVGGSFIGYFYHNRDKVMTSSPTSSMLPTELTVASSAPTPTLVPVSTKTPIPAPTHKPTPNPSSRKY